MLDNVPLRAALALADFEDALPVQLVLADDGFRTAAAGLDVKGLCAARIFFQFRHRITATVAAIAGVELRDDVRLRVAAEQIPGSFAINLLEAVPVRVVTNPPCVSL